VLNGRNAQARSPRGRAGERNAGMKVVLFCGGLGMRIREYSEVIPKPMVPVGNRPIMWHLMRYYAHYGHRDFILCLGYRGDVIKSYFVDYKEWLSNDFVLSRGADRIEMLARDIEDWRITFVETGLRANIGERLLAVRHHLEGEEAFLANYADGLTDAPLDQMLERFHRSGKTGSLLAVRPRNSFHALELGANGAVASVQDAGRAGFWVNGGFFAFRRGIFDVLRPGDELVSEPFQRLIAQQELIAYRHEGFWIGMDTFKERQLLDDLWEQGTAPWAVWLQRALAPV
jgi:glucose-1-phosphate cytidylyltransferase